jgi:hypothetical protein
VATLHSLLLQRDHTSKGLGGRFQPKLACFGERLEGLAGDFLPSFFQRVKNYKTAQTS